jgi:hypothetical protein
MKIGFCNLNHNFWFSHELVFEDMPTFLETENQATSGTNDPFGEFFLGVIHLQFFTIWQDCAVAGC